MGGAPGAPADQAPEISVVAPFYNAELYIERCIRGLLSQTLPASRFEIIMVDNNSTDGSASIARRYPSIGLVRESRQGSYAARNRGVRAARGQLIAFIDADCVPVPDWLERIAAALQTPPVKLVQGGRSYPPASRGLELLAAYESERTAFLYGRPTNCINYGYTNNMAVRRELLEDIGPFIEIYRGADSLFVQSVVRKHSSSVLSYLPAASVCHLEVVTELHWILKRFVYARSFNRYYYMRKSSSGLSDEDGVEIFRRTIQQMGCSRTEARYLAVLLNFGNLLWRFGRLTTRQVTVAPS